MHRLILKFYLNNKIFVRDVLIFEKYIYANDDMIFI